MFADFVDVFEQTGVGDSVSQYGKLVIFSVKNVEGCVVCIGEKGVIITGLQSCLHFVFDLLDFRHDGRGGLLGVIQPLIGLLGLVHIP